MSLSSCAVIVPCYNEAERLPHFFKELEGFSNPAGWHIYWILVDDGSQDETLALMQSKAGPSLEVIRQEPNQGKGAAVRAGAERAGERFDVVAFMDVDLSTPLSFLADGLAAIDAGADLAIASRHAPGSHLVKAQGFLRILVGRAFSFFTSLFHRNAFTDTQCGLKLWTKRVNRDVATQLRSPRWSFDMELILRCEKLNLRVQEFPVTWTNDERSKVSVWKDGTRMLRETLHHWWQWGDKRLVFATLVFVVMGMGQAMRTSNELSVYFTEAWSKIAHGNFDIYEIGRKDQGGYYYSPFFALVGSWFEFVGFGFAKFLYGLATAAGFVCGWVLVKRLARNAGIWLGAGVGFLVLISLGNNLLGQMLTGNISYLVCLLSLLAFYHSTRSRPMAAAFFWAVAINFKVYPVYMGLYFLWKRDWRVLVYVVLFLVALFLFPAIFWGWERNWALHLNQIEMLKVYGPQNDFGRSAYQSLAALGYRLFGTGGLNPALGLKVGQFAALGINIWAFSRLSWRSLGDSVWAIAWTLACMGLATPASWVHHSGFVYAPLFALVFGVAARKKDLALNVALGLSVVLYALTTDGIWGRALNDRFEAWSVPTAGLLLLVWARFRAQRERREAF